MPWYVHQSGEHRQEDRLVGIECEKCHWTWRLTETTGGPANPYGVWPHPITGRKAE